MAGVIEFFCGMGGLACCLPSCCKSTGIDINQSALDVFKLNFDHKVQCKTIESLSADDVRAITPNADLWWMSPPCQPHTVRGLKRDVDDSRSAAFLNVIKLIEPLRPLQIGLENVPGFAESQSFDMLCTILKRCGYDWQTIELCPTQLGGLNRRPRFYMLASLEKFPSWQEIGTDPAGEEYQPFRPTLEDIAEINPLRVDDSTLRKYSEALHVVSGKDFLAGSVTTNCFTSAYGRSPVRSGSYLEDRFGIRRFSPREILWQLEFPRDYVLPAWPNKRLWPLVGNTLALRSVKYLLAHLRLDH